MSSKTITMLLSEHEYDLSQLKLKFEDEGYQKGFRTAVQGIRECLITGNSNLGWGKNTGDLQKLFYSLVEEIKKDKFSMSCSVTESNDQQ